jgi:hypothetical protein
MYFLPSRLLSITFETVTAYADWTSAMGVGDPWVGKPYQWTANIRVTPQTHSSHLTPTPYLYNGLDVVVGDWVADINLGLATKIVNISSQTANSVVAICEDVDRFNTFTDPTGQGNGIGSTGLGYLFSLNDESLPILAPMTSVYTTLNQNLAFQQDQLGRFQYRNYLKTFYRVDQPGNSFNIGDILVLNANSVYSKIDANTSAVSTIVGQVSSVGAPGPDWFCYRPNGRIVSNISLPGVPGELIYLSMSGLSNVAPTIWASPLYIQINNSTGISLNRGVDTAGSLGYTTQTYVVSNTIAANSLNSTLNIGDQIMINDSGSGEWAHYVYCDNTVTSNVGLRQIATQDSVSADAESMIAVITANTTLQNITVNNTVSTALLLGSIRANSSIVSATIDVNQVFSSNAVITIGTIYGVDSVIPTSLIDLTEVGDYTHVPDLNFTDPYTSIYAFVAYNGSNIGNATITISYI